MALEQLQKAGMDEGSTLSKDERTNCGQGEYHGLCTVNLYQDFVELFLSRLR